MVCYAAGHGDVALGCHGPHCADVPSADRLHAISKHMLAQQLGDRRSAIEQLAAVQVDQRKKVMHLDGCIHRIQHKFVIMVPLLKQLWRGPCD